MPVAPRVTWRLKAYTGLAALYVLLQLLEVTASILATSLAGLTYANLLVLLCFFVEVACLKESPATAARGRRACARYPAYSCLLGATLLIALLGLVMEFHRQAMSCPFFLKRP